MTCRELRKVRYLPIRVELCSLGGGGGETTRCTTILLQTGAIMGGDRKREIWPCPDDMGQNFYF